MNEVKRYTLQEINKYASDLSGLRFVLESEHDDSMAAVKSDKEKLADLIISAGFELVMMQRRHQKLIEALIDIDQNCIYLKDAKDRAEKAIVADARLREGHNDSVGPNEEDARGESVVQEVRTVVPSDGT